MSESLQAVAVTALNFLGVETIRTRNAQTVTASDNHAGRTISTRNDPLEQTVAWLEKQAEQTRQRVRQARAAKATGENCGKCGRALAPADTVWRVAINTAWGRKLTVLCSACRPPADGPWHTYLPEMPCAGCGRGVVSERTQRRRHHTFCSERCGWRYYDALVKESRAEARQKLCESCGKSFIATRRDGKACSSACRQRAYRQRQKVNMR